MKGITVIPILIPAAVLIFSTSIIPISLIQAQVQTETQSQILPPSLVPPPLIPQSQLAQKLPNPPPLQLPPGAIAIPPSQQRGPSLAQIQSDIAKGLQRSHSLQYAQAMGEEVQKRLGNDTSMAHEIQVLEQMTAEGKINCPTPFTNPGHCFFTPPGREFKLIPPEGPVLLPNNSTK